MATTRELRLLTALIQQRRGQPRNGVPAKLSTRILIAVDDHQAGKTLARTMNDMGYCGVRVVRRAASALFLAQQLGPSMVFVDVALSEDAYELARSLRQQAGQTGVRLIALTSSIEHSAREQARGAGFERWLVTPVERHEIDGLMRSVETAPVSTAEPPP